MAEVTIERLQELDPETVQGLADVLIDCTIGGASVGFMNPLDRAQAEAFWQAQADDIASGARAVCVARRDGRVVGTGQLVLAPMPNQPHRADIAKMLVLRSERGRGIGGAVLAAVEAEARARGRDVLVLDTASDDARRLYERNGWVRVGDVPDFALWPDGGRVATTFYYKLLSADETAL
ncbi:MAG: GNAT family N-acetyltransferase [Pseudomonadota bacterium]